MKAMIRIFILAIGLCLAPFPNVRAFQPQTTSSPNYFKKSMTNSLHSSNSEEKIFQKQINSYSRSVKESNSRLYLDGEGMAGKTFNKHILGDILRSLQPRYLTQVKQSIEKNIKGARVLNLESFCATYNNTSTSSKAVPPTWDELSTLLYKSQTKPERSFREKLENGGVHSPLATHRRFANTNDVKVTFYKDSASWCPYCQKVWIALEEKQIPYEVVRIDMNCYAGDSKPTEFLSIQPNGNLPCAEITTTTPQNEQITKVVDESDVILDVLDNLVQPSKRGNNADVPQLRPMEGTEEAEYMKYLCDNGRDSLERRLFAEWMWYLTGKRKPKEYRERYEAMLDEVELALSPNPNDADASLSRATLSSMAKGPFFMGEKISLADIKFIPFVERQAASLAYFKGFELRNKNRWPNLVRWLEAMESKTSYQQTKSDYYTHSQSLPPQLSGGCTFYEGCENLRDSIDAYAKPTNSDIEKEQQQAFMDWREPGWNVNSKEAKREAAERMIFNHKNIVRFSCRAAGTPGFPAASAPLADPKSLPNDSAYFPVDIFLRHIIHSMLSSGEPMQNFFSTKFDLEEAAFELASCGNDSAEAVIDCLDYLRLRIGVPRDMSYPAATELKKALLQVTTVLNSASINSKKSEKEVELI